MLKPIANLLNNNSSITIEIKVVPNSSRQAIMEFSKNSQQKISLRIKLKSPPEKGQANQELIEFLSQELNLPKSNFSIIKGLTKAHKIIKIHALQ